MKFLIDNALSPISAKVLGEAGHDSVHVREMGMASSDDEDIFELAEKGNRVLVSADTDFSALLALRQKTSPSFILFRKNKNLRPDEIASQILIIAEKYVQELKKGCIITITDNNIRIRMLPIV